MTAQKIFDLGADVDNYLTSIELRKTETATQQGNIDLRLANLIDEKADLADQLAALATMQALIQKQMDAITLRELELSGQQKILAGEQGSAAAHPNFKLASEVVERIGAQATIARLLSSQKNGNGAWPVILSDKSIIDLFKLFEATKLLVGKHAIIPTTDQFNIVLNDYRLQHNMAHLGHNAEKPIVIQVIRARTEAAPK